MLIIKLPDGTEQLQPFGCTPCTEDHRALTSAYCPQCGLDLTEI